jgi:hypothetical protein
MDNRFDTTTVTLPLVEFDNLRSESVEYWHITNSISQACSIVDGESEIEVTIDWSKIAHIMRDYCDCCKEKKVTFADKKLNVMLSNFEGKIKLK